MAENVSKIQIQERAVSSVSLDTVSTILSNPVLISNIAFFWGTTTPTTAYVECEWSQRTDLLGHPVCMALIRYKWNKFGRQAYIFTLLLNILFCLFLTIYTISTPAPYSHSQIAEHTGL